MRCSEYVQSCGCPIPIFEHPPGNSVQQDTLTASFLVQAGAEAKKESFRKYLDSAGVVDSLTKGVVFSHGPCPFTVSSMQRKSFVL